MYLMQHEAQKHLFDCLSWHSFSSDNCIINSWRKSNFVNVYGLNVINHDLLLIFILIFITIFKLILFFDIMPWFAAINEKGLLCQSRNHFKWQGCRSTLGVKQGKSIIQWIILSYFTHCILLIKLLKCIALLNYHRYVLLWSYCNRWGSLPCWVGHRSCISRSW